jgi:HK97 family phage portal protein
MENENKSRLQRVRDFVTGNRNTEQKKYQGRYNQSYSLDSSIFGYNTTSGFWETKQLEEIGDGSANSAVIACLNVLSTAFSEPMLQIVKMDNDGNREVNFQHPLFDLWRRPNPFMSSNLISHYIVLAINTTGDAFLYKNRNNKGEVVQLVPLMPNLVEVRGNEEKLITHYNYFADGNGEPLKLPYDDVVHIRQGIDPNDHRRGHAPLKGVLREILGDEAAGQWSAALLHNMAVPGVVLSPRNDAMGGPTREEAEAISESYKQKFGGNNRGAPMVLSGSMNVDIVSFSPDQMKLQELRRLPEERISAVLGVPAILAGLGAGLDSATYNNTRELREFFTEQKLIPLWKTVANELTHQLLLPDFKDTEYICDYDYTKVRALQEDMDELYKRVNTGVQGGWITIGEARRVVGLETDDRHNIYLRPLNMIQIGTDGEPLLERDRAIYNGEGEKDLLGLSEFPVDATRQRLVESVQRLSEEKYVAQMPNGAWCVLSHDDNEVIKCFKTEEEAESYLSSMKKEYEDDVDIKVSTEEAEVLEEIDSDSWRSEKKEKPKKDRTNFPSPGDDKKVSISNSKYREFPYGYARDLKENWPEIWRLAGNGGNPPTSFTGNDAFRNWAKYKSGDRSESVLNWVRRRERYMGRHQGNTRLNGTIANIKWGGVSNIGVPAMKKIINERKKLVRERRKKSLEYQKEMIDEYYLTKVSAGIRKILTNKLKEHNAKNPKHTVQVSTLVRVFNRGVGAYRTNPGSVRGNVTGAEQWGVARVNGFLHALRTGRFKRKPYDTDLLPSSHPLSSKKSGEKASSVRVGQSVSWSINKDPDPPSTVHGVVVSTSDGEATMQVWAIMENGKHKRTDRRVTMPISKLTVIKDITNEKTQNLGTS